MLTWSIKLNSLLDLGWSGAVFIVSVQDIQWSPTYKLCFKWLLGQIYFKNFKEDSQIDFATGNVFSNV